MLMWERGVPTEQLKAAGPARSASMIREASGRARRVREREVPV